MKALEIGTILAVAGTAAMLTGLVAQAATSCGETASATIDGKKVWKADAGVGFRSAGLAVDADGAPNSYRVDGKGLSYTCDGVTATGSTPQTDPAHWQEKCRAAWAQAQKTGDYSKVRIFGFLTGKNNVPVIQKDGDPLPNVAYITTTSVSVPDAPDGTQRHWVDATRIPYVVLSPPFLKKYGVAPGDVAVVYRPNTDKAAFAVYGDGGGLGEASVKLHQDLGSNPLVTANGVQRAKRGIGDDIVTVVFPGRHTHPTVDAATWRKDIDQVGAKALADWGGMDRLRACAK